MEDQKEIVEREGRSNVSICELYRHEQHQPGACGYVTFYGRGPNSPPGNSRCTCGGIIPLSVPKFEDDIQRQKAVALDWLESNKDGSEPWEIENNGKKYKGNTLLEAINAARESEEKK